METPTEAPLRPIVGVVLALVLGTELGLGPLQGEPTAAVAIGAALVVAATRARRAGALGLALVLALSLVRAQDLPTPPRTTAAFEGAVRGEATVGRFRRLAGGLGWIDAGARPARLVELDGTRAEHGAAVALAVDLEAVPWPTGPERGPLARAFPAGVARVRPDELVVLEPEREPGSSRLVARTRAAVGERLDASFGPTWGGLARALVTGDRRGLPAEVSDLFTRTGLRHVLAISGLHVALAAGLLLLPVVRRVERSRSRRGALVARGCAGLVLVAFGALAGGASPVRRAVLVLALALAGPLLPSFPGAPRGLGRRAHGLSLWSLALAIEVLLDPRATRSLSVQLSYLATLGILVATPPLAARLLRRVPRGRAGLGARAASTGRVLLVRGTRGVALGVAASASAVLATAPLTWTTFGELAPAGILLTPLALPLLVVALVACWTVALLPACVASACAGALGGLAFELLVGALATVDGLPGTPVPLPARPGWLVAVASALALAALARGGPRLAGAAKLVAGVLLVPWSLAPANLEVVALDVGHGTAVVARAPGAPTIVFDAGSRDRPRVYREALAPLLARWETSRVVVILSHADADHASGLERLATRYPPRAWLGARLAANPSVGTSVASTETADAHGALELAFEGSALRLELLRASDRAGNEGSRSALLRLGERAALLCGDAEDEGLARLLRAPWAPGPVDLLLVPHHGSDSPWLVPLLERVRPGVLWVSHPGRPAVADELDRRGLDWRSTGLHGSRRWTPGEEGAGEEGGERGAREGNASEGTADRARRGERIR